MQLQQMEQR